MSEKLVTVTTAQNQAEAEFIQNLLGEYGIQSMLRRSAGFDVPDYLAAGQRDILVPEDQAIEARQLLADADMRDGSPPVSPAAVKKQILLIALALIAAVIICALIVWLASP